MKRPSIFYAQVLICIEVPHNLGDLTILDLFIMSLFFYDKEKTSHFQRIQILQTSVFNIVSNLPLLM